MHFAGGSKIPLIIIVLVLCIGLGLGISSLTNAQSNILTATPTAPPSQPNIFGAMMPLDKGGRKAIVDLNPKFYRNINSIFASDPLSCNSCQAAIMGGYQLVITIRANHDGSPPADLTTFGTFVQSVIDTFKPWGIVIENEENKTSSYTGTPAQYLDELNTACGVAATNMVKCMNGGLSGDGVLLMIWYYTYGGYPNKNACNFAQEAFDPTTANTLCYNPTPDIGGYISTTKSFYDLYSTSSINYVNMHYYVEATSTGTNVAKLNDAINYMAATGKPVLINEWGLRVNNTSVLTQAMNILRFHGLPVAIYFSPSPSAGFNDYTLQNDNGTLTNMGVTFRDYIASNWLK